MLALKYSNIFRRIPASIRSRVVTAKHFASGSTVHDDDPTVLEVEKGWNEYLASSSEAHVKADRHGQDGPPTVELSERTIKHVQRRHHRDRYPRSSREEASYERDEVEGPLKTSSAGNTENMIADEMQGKATPSEEAVKAERGEV